MISLLVVSCAWGVDLEEFVFCFRFSYCWKCFGSSCSLIVFKPCLRPDQSLMQWQHLHIMNCRRRRLIFSRGGSNSKMWLDNGWWINIIFVLFINIYKLENMAFRFVFYVWRLLYCLGWIVKLVAPGTEIYWILDLLWLPCFCVCVCVVFVRGILVFLWFVLPYSIILWVIYMVEKCYRL